MISGRPLPFGYREYLGRRPTIRPVRVENLVVASEAGRQGNI